jgi:hypothetical protein
VDLDSKIILGSNKKVDGNVRIEANNKFIIKYLSQNHWKDELDDFEWYTGIIKDYWGNITCLLIPDETIESEIVDSMECWLREIADWNIFIIDIK